MGKTGRDSQESCGCPMIPGIVQIWAGAAWDSGKCWDWSWRSFKVPSSSKPVWINGSIQNFPVQRDHPLDCDGGFGIIRAGFDPGYVGVVSMDISSSGTKGQEEKQEEKWENQSFSILPVPVFTEWKHPAPTINPEPWGEFFFPLEMEFCAGITWQPTHVGG